MNPDAVWQNLAEVFQITTDTGEVWVSLDGISWRQSVW